MWIMLSICTLGSRRVRGEEHIYITKQQNILWQCGVLLLGAAGGCRNSEETRFDYTIQNMSDFKKSCSQIIRHKKRVFGGWGFIVVFKDE